MKTAKVRLMCDVDYVGEVRFSLDEAQALSFVNVDEEEVTDETKFRAHLLSTLGVNVKSLDDVSRDEAEAYLRDLEEKNGYRWGSECSCHYVSFRNAEAFDIYFSAKSFTDREIEIHENMSRDDLHNALIGALVVPPFDGEITETDDLAVIVNGEKHGYDVMEHLEYDLFTEFGGDIFNDSKSKKSRDDKEI